MAKILRPDGTSNEVAPANGSNFVLAELQAIVEGHIEIVPTRDGSILVCNEESKILDLPRNDQATALVDFPEPAEILARMAELKAQGVNVFFAGDLDEPDYVAGTALLCESHEVK